MHVQNILCDNFSQANSKDVMNSQLLIVLIICLQAYILKIIEGKIKKNTWRYDSIQLEIR